MFDMKTHPIPIRQQKIAIPYSPKYKNAHAITTRRIAFPTASCSSSNCFGSGAFTGIAERGSCTGGGSCCRR